MSPRADCKRSTREKPFNRGRARRERQIYLRVRSRMENDEEENIQYLM